MVIIGGGIIGLALAKELSEADVHVVVLEKEKRLAQHQTGRNSGVIHAGPYYKPGSLKARLCAEGNQSIVRFAAEHGIPYEITGKLLLATSRGDANRLHSLAERAAANGVPAEIIGEERIRELEPFTAGKTALHVKSTGIIDYGTVARKFGELSENRGAELILDAEVTGIRSVGKEVVVEHSQGVSRGSMLINAAGLHSDRIARLAGLNPPLMITPFRGEYFELSEEAATKVKGLIYPVPNPALPFLGVHLTKMIGGGIHAGPNAVLAFAREGYTWGAINLRDLWSTLSYPGFSLLAMKNLPAGAKEIIRSLSPALFARDLSKLVPGIHSGDLIKVDAGVRAQAIDKRGRLVDDFFIQRTKNQVHILNAPSPAATASISIAQHIIRSISSA